MAVVGTSGHVRRHVPVREDDFDEKSAQRFGVGDRDRRYSVLAGETVPLEFEDAPVFGCSGVGDPDAHSALVLRIDRAGGESAAHEMIDGAAHRLICHTACPRHFSLRHRLCRNRMQSNHTGVGESPPAKPLFPRALDEPGGGREQPSGGPCLQIVGSSIVQHAE